MEDHKLKEFTLVQELEYVLEQSASALKDKRPIEPDILRHNIFRAKMMSEILSLLRDNITKENRKELGKKIYEEIEFESKMVNYLRKLLLELCDEYFVDKTQFKPKTFDERQKENYEAKKATKSTFGNHDTYFEHAFKNPVSELYKLLKTFVWERRLFRRYLKSRFGVKVLPYKTITLKRASRRKIKFYDWAVQNINFNVNCSKGEIDIALKKWEFYLLNEKHSFNYAFERLTNISSTIEVIQNTFFLSFFINIDSEPKSPLTEEALSLDILIRLKPILKRMADSFRITQIELKQEFFLNYENDLMDLTSSIATQLSLKVNKNIEKTLLVEGNDVENQLLQKIPGSILIALDENPKPHRKLKLLSAVDKLLRVELPLDHRHENIRQSQLNRKKIAADSPNTQISSPHTKIVKPEDLSDLQTRDFVLREDAKISLAQIINKANLTKSEKEVFLLKAEGLTENEIAQKLNKAIGTVKSLMFRANRRIKNHIK